MQKEPMASALVTSAPAQQATADNVLATSSEAEAWMNERGLRLVLPSMDDSDASPPRLILRTIRYRDAANDKMSEAFFTTSLLTDRAVSFVDGISPLEIGPAYEQDVTTLKNITATRERSRIVEQDIEAGAILMTERPTILVPPVLALGAISASPKELFEAVFERLSSEPGKPKTKGDKTEPGPSQRDSIRRLKDCKPNATCSEEGIIRTNGIMVDLDGEPYCAVFYRIARINHSFVTDWLPISYVLTRNTQMLAQLGNVMGRLNYDDDRLLTAQAECQR
jgi:hypothetical protein